MGLYKVLPQDIDEFDVIIAGGKWQSTPLLFIYTITDS